MEKEIRIAEVIATNAGDQRFRLCAPLSDRNNINPSSDLIASSAGIKACADKEP